MSWKTLPLVQFLRQAQSRISGHNPRNSLCVPVAKYRFPPRFEVRGLRFKFEQKSEKSVYFKDLNDQKKIGEVVFKVLFTVLSVKGKHQRVMFDIR